MPEAINRESWVWSATGVKPAPGDEVYARQEQPLAEYDNSAMWSITTDIRNLSETLGDHSARHEVGGADPINLDGLSYGSNPQASITETTSPSSFNFSGSEAVDIFRAADVTLENTSAASATEDVTFSLYDGTSTAGTLIAQGTRSVTVAAGSTTTVTFTPASHLRLDDGTYHIDLSTSGTTLGVTQTVVQTAGGEFTFSEADAELLLAGYDGTTLAALDSVKKSWRVFPAFETEIQANAGINLGGAFDTAGNNIVSGATVIWDDSAQHIPTDRLQSSTVTVAPGAGLTADNGTGAVGLGGTVTLAVNDGPNSGLDADTLDGVQGANYVRADQDDTLAGQYGFTASGSFTAPVGTGSGEILRFAGGNGSDLQLSLTGGHGRTAEAWNASYDNVAGAWEYAAANEPASIISHVGHNPGAGTGTGHVLIGAAPPAAAAGNTINWQFLTYDHNGNLNLRGGEVQGMQIENRTTRPASPEAGRMIFRTDKTA